MSELTFVLSRAHKVDEVEYSISVYQSPEGFLTFWECLLCTDQERLPVASADREAALKKCETLINEHHAHFHTAVRT